MAPVYENMEFAARETNAFAAWSEILAALEPTVGDSPVFRVHYLSAQLMLARSREDLQKEPAVLANLRTLLTEAEAAAGVAVGSDEDLAADTYALAHGYALLEETPTSRQRLDRLEKTEPGRRLAASMRHFGFFRRLMEVRDGSGSPAMTCLPLVKSAVSRRMDAARVQPQVEPRQHRTCRCMPPQAKTLANMSTATRMNSTPIARSRACCEILVATSEPSCAPTITPGTVKTTMLVTVDSTSPPTWMNR